MSLDMLPSCSSPPHANNLLGQLSARLAAVSILSGSGSLCASSSASSSSSSSSSCSPLLPPSPPPMGAARHFNRMNRKFVDPTTATELRYVQNAIAVAVLVRLHRWCCQLFWLTIVCLISYCSDQQRQQQEQKQQQRRRNRDGKHHDHHLNSDDMAAETDAGDGGASADQQQQHRRTFREVRKSIVHATQRRGTKTVTELEMQLLRHLTCPQTAVLRPLRPSHHKKRHFLSRPPSPQLFDISEENDEQ